MVPGELRSFRSVPRCPVRAVTAIVATHRDQAQSKLPTVKLVVVLPGQRQISEQSHDLGTPSPVPRFVALPRVRLARSGWHPLAQAPVPTLAGKELSPPCTTAQGSRAQWSRCDLATSALAKPKGAISAPNVART